MIAWGTYRAVLIEPPWTYRDKCNDGARGAAHKYPVLTAADLADFPVGRLAAPDSACFLWVTPPLLPVGLELLAAWDFSYKTVAFTWIKESAKGTLAWGMGHWTRANAEHVLLGVRGRPGRASVSDNVRIMEPVDFHGQALTVIDQDGQPFVAMRPIAEGMGLDWKSQHRKITEETQRWGTVVIMTMDQSADGRRTICSSSARRPHQRKARRRWAR